MTFPVVCGQHHRLVLLHREGKIHPNARHILRCQIAERFEHLLTCQNILLLAGSKHIQAQSAIKVALGKSAARKDCRHQIHVRLRAQQCLTELADRSRYIFRALHPALDFKGADAHPCQLLHPVGKAEVLQRQRISAVPSASARERQTARLRAQSPVPAALSNHRAHIALTGNAHTQRSVYKHLCFNRHLSGNGSDFLPAHLSCQHNSGKSQLLGLPCARNIVDGQLGRSVHRHLRRCLAHQCRHSKVLHNQGIDAVAAGNLQRL